MEWEDGVECIGDSSIRRAKSEHITLVHLRLQSLAKSPLPPFCQRGEREARGDLSQYIMCTNLPWPDLAAWQLRRDGGRRGIVEVQR
jgi:hypothetical protein